MLNVYGSTGADAVTFRQSGGWLAIDGIYNAWTTAQVSRVDVYLRSGNDTVTMNGLTENLVVLTGGNTKTVRFGDGSQTSYSGNSDLLLVWDGVLAKLNGNTVYDKTAPAPPTPPAPPSPPTPPAPPSPVSNWFTANVQDAALRALGSTLYADSIISRADIIALFDSAEDNGNVDSTELTDLRTIVANTTLFAGAEHVWKLASYVVSANAANGMYQNTSLGSLAAGSSAAHLDKLVSKWFYGSDRPTASGTYRQFTGQLFVNGATYTDVRQGSVGDCYFVAALAEAAQHNPALINNMFIVNGDGTYTVKFFNGGQSYYVTVDSYLPTNASGQAIYAARGTMYNNSGAELWTALAEKAYAQLNAMGWSRAGMTGSGLNSYNAISGGYILCRAGACHRPGDRGVCDDQLGVELSAVRLGAQRGQDDRLRVEVDAGVFERRGRARVYGGRLRCPVPARAAGESVGAGVWNSDAHLAAGAAELPVLRSNGVAVPRVATRR